MPGRRQHGEGSLYRRGKRGGRPGQWVAVADLGWRNGRRDRREFTGATKDEAIARRQRFLDRRRDGFTMPRGRPPYVSEWLLHWLHNIARPKVAASTWEKSYRQKVTSLIAPWFDRVPLPDLTEEHIEEWHRELAGTVSSRTRRPLSAQTIQHCHRILSSALRVAVTRQRLARNPAANVRPPRVLGYEAQVPAAGEIRAILARCESWPYGARWVVAIATGIRQGEALALRWRDVRLDGEHPHLVIRDGKSQAAVRTVPLAPVAVTALRTWRKAQVRQLHDDQVFPRPPGSLAVKDSARQRADWQDWQDLSADLGLPRYRPHDLRHAFATYLLEEGVDVRVVQVVIGHATPDFTRRAYQHVRQALHDQAADAIERHLRG